MMLVVVSRSGSWLPRMARANGAGAAVLRSREVPAVAIAPALTCQFAAWVTAIIGAVGRGQAYDGRWDKRLRS